MRGVLTAAVLVVSLTACSLSPLHRDASRSPSESSSPSATPSTALTLEEQADATLQTAVRLLVAQDTGLFRGNLRAGLEDDTATVTWRGVYQLSTETWRIDYVLREGGDPVDRITYLGLGDRRWLHVLERSCWLRLSEQTFRGIPVETGLVDAVGHAMAFGVPEVARGRYFSKESAVDNEPPPAWKRVVVADLTVPQVVGVLGGDLVGYVVKHKAFRPRVQARFHLRHGRLARWDVSGRDLAAALRDDGLEMSRRWEQEMEFREASFTLGRVRGLSDLKEPVPSSVCSPGTGAGNGGTANASWQGPSRLQSLLTQH